MQREQIVRRTWEVLEPELASIGFELVEVEFGREDVGDVLRLYIDREGGITIDHCVEVSRYVGPVLDKEDFIEEAYNLEVSSPGIDRPLRKPSDFARFAGEAVKVETVTPIGGRRRYAGRLIGYEDGLISVDCDGTVHTVHVENVKRAKLAR